MAVDEGLILLNNVEIEYLKKRIYHQVGDILIFYRRRLYFSSSTRSIIPQPFRAMRERYVEFLDLPVSSNHLITVWSLHCERRIGSTREYRRDSYLATMADT